MRFAARLLEPPDRVELEAQDSRAVMLLQSPDQWTAAGARVGAEQRPEGLCLWLEAPQSSVQRVFLRWRMPVAGSLLLLGDQWERGYGDLEWRGVVAERVMPWYVIAWDGQTAEGFGVAAQPGALAYWQVDGGGVSLVLDVSCGGSGVQLGPRRLEMACVVTLAAPEGISPFAAARAFCHRLSPRPRLPDHPVYGINDWYYAYGSSTARSILADARLTAELAAGAANRPYAVIDAGWSNEDSVAAADTGIRTRGNARFPDMPALAAQLSALGVRPAIWTRPLIAPPGFSPAALLSVPAEFLYSRLPILDPSLPDNLALIEEDTRRLADWGYRLIKHDFSTVDLLGRWGFSMGAQVTAPGWAFLDRTRTTAEIIRAFYAALRRGAGDALLIGCNTIGHLGAGLFELNRTGDDTSGQEWERTRKMGVNTLAFRMPQHGAFFAADADCVGLTRAVPWELNRRWLDLLARSGTPLFVSAEPEAIGPEQRRALAQAFALAAQTAPPVEPLDWLDTTCPTRWQISAQPHTFNWWLD
jgi:alpha-galactosidase